MYELTLHVRALGSKGLSPHDFFRACNALEYILGFAQSLNRELPLDIFGIKFE